MTNRPKNTRTILGLTILLVGFIAVLILAWMILRQPKSAIGPQTTDTPVSATGSSGIPNGVMVSGQLVKEGNRYYLLNVPDFVEVSIANSYEKNVRAELNKLIGSQITATGKLAPGRTDLTLAKINELSVYSSLEEFDKRPALPYFPSIFIGLTNQQQVCLDRVIGRDRLYPLIQNEVVELSVDERTALAECLQ